MAEVPLENVPNVEHYAIVTEESIYVPGERGMNGDSREDTQGFTRKYTSYCPYMSKQDWTEKIEELYKAGKSFKALHVMPAMITLQINTGESAHREKAQTR